MTSSEHKAYKFAHKLQETIKEKEFTQEQVRMILSLLLEENGFKGMANQLAAYECDIRDFDNYFFNNRCGDGEFGVITFGELSLALLSYTDRFSLEGLANRHGRSKTYKLDEKAAEKLVFFWRDTQSTADIKNTEPEGEAAK